MNDSLKHEVYSYIRGVQNKKIIIVCALPISIYFVYRIILKTVFHKSGIPMSKLALVPMCIVFLVSVIFIVKNISDRVRLRARINEICSGNERKILEEDMRYGNAYLDRNLIIGRKYIISKGSSRLFSFDELSGVFDDIRDTYNIFTMILSGADDIVKTKIIKAEYNGKSFIHDRRICEIQVHKSYSSSVGNTNGYEQLKAIEDDLWQKINYWKTQMSIQSNN